MTPPLDENGSDTPVFKISDEVAHMISQIETLGDVTPENLHSLKALLERSVTLPIFDINLEQFKVLHKQFIDIGLTGVEYYGSLSRIVLKPYSNQLVQAAVNGISAWFQQTVEILQGEGRPTGSVLGLSAAGYNLTGEYSKTVKEADLCLSHINDSLSCIALCVSCKEARVELMYDAKHWLYGTDQNTQAVIAIETTERNCPDLRESWVHSVNLSLWESVEAFTKDVIYLENTEGPTMVGLFVASLWILTPSNFSIDAFTMPFPAYIYECRDPSNQGLGHVTGSFSGSACISHDFSMQILGTSASLNFVQFEETLLKGIVKFHTDRMSNLAAAAWEQHVNARNQAICVR